MKIRKPLPPPEFVEARFASPGARYVTAQTAHRTLVEVVGTTVGGKVTLRAWYPNLRDWSEVAVEGTYKLSPEREGIMPSASMPRKSAGKNAIKSLGVKSKKNVPDTWGLMFQKHGTKQGAVKLIADGMRGEFPGRKTQWDKWVNVVRIKYNNGLLGVPKPADPIKPYKNGNPVKVFRKPTRPILRAKPPKAEPQEVVPTEAG